MELWVKIEFSQIWMWWPWDWMWCPSSWCDSKILAWFYCYWQCEIVLPSEWFFSTCVGTLFILCSLGIFIDVCVANAGYAAPGAHRQQRQKMQHRIVYRQRENELKRRQRKRQTFFVYTLRFSMPASIGCQLGEKAWEAERRWGRKGWRSHIIMSKFCHIRE